MESKHTPGPWIQDGLCIYGPEDERSRHPNGRTLIGGVVTERQDWNASFGEARSLAQHTEESRANAALIAAAPDLLAALERSLTEMEKCKGRCGEGDDNTLREGIEQARSALTRARSPEAKP